MAAPEAFTGQHPFVKEYLIEEIVSRQPEAVRRFLEQTSILERLCGPLCEAVTLQPDADATLAYLWHANLFTEPLDDGGHWYRRHHLLAEVLLGQLQLSQPDQLSELHGRARDWYARNGLLAEAIHHALAAHTYDWIADLIEGEYRNLVARGELVTLRRWLESLPEQLIESRVRCCLAYGWALGHPGRIDQLERWLGQAETLAADVTGPPAADVTGPPVRAIRGEILALRAVAASLRGRTANVAEMAQQALDLAPAGDRLTRAVAWQALGNSYRLRGRPEEGRQAFETVLSLGAAIGGPVTLAATVRLGQVMVMAGQLRQAEQIFQQALAQVQDNGAQLALYTSEARIRLGDVYREWGRLAEAEQHVRQGLELGRQADNAPAMLSGYFTLAHVQVALGQLGEAGSTLREARALAGRLDFPRLIERVNAHQAWLDLKTGRLAAAAAWAADYAANRVLPDGPAEVAMDFQDLLLARIWLAEAKAGQALRAARDARETAQRAGRGWTVVQGLALEALAQQAGGQLAEAKTTLAGALDLGAGGGYLRLFLDEGEPMRVLLAGLVEPPGERVGPAAFAAHLLEAFAGRATSETAPKRRAASAGPALVEPLTARETEVLRLLVEGDSNREIAEALVISVGTVKSHINRILGKLAVRSRTQAIARAHALDLV